MNRSGLDELVSSFRFVTENGFLYILPGLFLTISLPIYVSTTITIISNGSLPWYSSFSLLTIGYVLIAGYLGYRLDKLLIQHLIDSGITSYYWLKKSEQIESIKALYRSGFIKRNLPSPLTALILSIFTMGLAYPILLYIFEKNLRDHCHGEEKLFLGNSFTKRIDAGQALIDIAATILTIGIYLIYWNLRIVKTYNRHIKFIHGRHPNPPITGRRIEYEEFPPTPVFAFGLALLGAGIYGLLGLYGLTPHYAAFFGYGLLLGAVSYSYSRKNIFSQIGVTYLYVYIVLVSMIITGFIGAPGYYDIGEMVEKQVKTTISNDLIILTRNIFFNNLGISIASISPLFGSVLMGIGIGNSGIYLGVKLASLPPLQASAILIILVFPHTLLELLAYACFISLSTRIIHGDRREVLSIFLLGLTILFIAALVEAFTYVLFTT